LFLLQDQLISSDNSKLYYSHVSKTMKLPPNKLDEFYRLDPPNHCHKNIVLGVGTSVGTGALANTIGSISISKLYYSHVSKTMKLPPNKLDEFYRFFPISGMAHCGPRTVSGALPSSTHRTIAIRTLSSGSVPA
jgi:hypothetical protein